MTINNSEKISLIKLQFDKKRTYAQIGKEFGVSRQRIHQILKETNSKELLERKLERQKKLKFSCRKCKKIFFTRKSRINSKFCSLSCSRFKSYNYIERFWGFVDKKSDNECWEWKGTRTRANYGRVKINKHVYYAHRACWELFNSKIPKGLVICHSCDNPPCVNPKHLWLGTQLENIIDRDKKGRGRVAIIKV